MNSVLERLAQNIFREPYASDGKIRGIFAPARKFPKSIAMTKPVIQINGPRSRRYLCFDIDRQFGGIAWDDCNLPPPNLIMVNPRNLHAHLVYELEETIWLKRKDDKRPGEAKPVRYLKAVQKAMGRALKADSAYNGLLVKNPFHASWRVSSARDRPYTLGELSEHLDLADVGAELVDNSAGRNCTLFDSIRYWGYRHLSDYHDLSSFQKDLHDELDRLNYSLPIPLPWKETRDIGKSVSSWVWDNYTGSGRVKRRGVMGLDPSESLRIRQQKGQAYSSRVVRDTNLERVVKAIRILNSQGKRLTKVSVASLCGLNRNTVAGYWLVAIETVSLRDKSSSSLRSGASPTSQGDTLIPTNTSTPDGLTYQEVLERHHDVDRRVIRAVIYAVQQAKSGILIEGAPEKLKPLLLREVDMWRNMRSRTPNDECTNRRTT